jgi:hypothetical protein
MSLLASIFLDFNLPNAATWFYFAVLLAVALFFKFSRLLSVRNWDVLTLFLLVPGLLLLQEAHTTQATLPPDQPLTTVRTLAAAGQALAAPSVGLGNIQALTIAASPMTISSPRTLWLGYLWLFCGSAYFLSRCVVDLALVRRPALAPNLNLSGMAWLAGALFVCLVAVAVRRPAGPAETLAKRPAAVNEIQRQAENLVQHEIVSDQDHAVDVSFWVKRTLAILCHLAVVVGLALIGWRHFQDLSAGMAAATFYLLLPYTAYHVGLVEHVWPTALLIWTVVAYRRPCLAGHLLGLAAGIGYFPALVFPVWLSFYWRRGAGRFAVAFLGTAGLCLAGIGGILWMGGELAQSLHSTLMLSDWQPWKEPLPGTEGFWTGIHWAWAYRMPVFIAYLAFVATVLFWPMPKNLAQVLALSAAILIGIQFWYADQGGVYVLWYLPLFLLLVFRPNLSDRVPAVIEPQKDWLVRLRCVLGRAAAWLLKLPDPVARVH